MAACYAMGYIVAGVAVVTLLIERRRRKHAETQWEASMRRELSARLRTQEVRAHHNAFVAEQLDTVADIARVLNSSPSFGRGEVGRA